MKIKRQCGAAFWGTILLLAAGISVQAQLNYTTLQVPGQSGTEAYGISGDNVVGIYANSSGQEGFLYNISSDTYTTLPWIEGIWSPFAMGISGNNIVGYYFSGLDHSFLYNINNNAYTILNVPGAYNTVAAGISGTNIVGYYENGSNITVGFLYNGSSYTDLDVPGASYTEANGISGNRIVGTSSLGSFYYNGSSYTILPLIEGQYTPLAQGISGNNIVGSYNDGGNEQAFEYNVLARFYTLLDVPGSWTNKPRGLTGATSSVNTARSTMATVF